jgi:hypothetical protein
MTTKFKKADYDKTLDLQIKLRDALPPLHSLSAPLSAGFDNYSPWRRYE